MTGNEDEEITGAVLSYVAENDEDVLISPVRQQQRLNVTNGEDMSSATYVVFFMLGLATLFPWNVFISATEFFEQRLADTPSLAAVFVNNAMLIFQLACIATLCACVFIQERYSATCRVIGSLSVQLVCLVAMTGLVGVNVGTHAFYGLMLFLTALSAVATGVLQSASVGLSALLPPYYTNGVMVGQGLAGVIVAVGSVITTATGNGVAQLTALLYFGLATLTLALCLVLTAVVLPPVIGNLGVMMSSTANESESRDSVDGVDWQEGRKLPWAAVVKATWREMTCIVVNFAITLAVFPVATAHVMPATAPIGSTYQRLFVPVYCFLGFNVGDTAGRLLAAKRSIPIGPLATLVGLRALFVPLFFMCNMSSSSSPLPQVFQHSDIWPIAFMVFFSVTNGAWATIAITDGTRQTSLAHRECAGAVLSLCVPIGLALGSLLALCPLTLAAAVRESTV